MRHEAPDAVWVCVPPAAHGPIEHALVARRIPFFVEKPLSADRSTAEEIAAAVESSGLIVGVGYQWRALDTLPEVRSTLASRPPRMVLVAWHGSTPTPVWWRHQEESGGQMVEQATHLIDLARLLVGEGHVIAATAGRHERAEFPDASIADVSAALVRFDGDEFGGVSAVFTATCLLDGSAAVYLQLVCEGLLITITQEHVIYDTGRERRKVSTGADPAVIIDKAFLQAVREQNPLLLFSSYADALRTHRLCHDVLDAYR